MSSEEAKAAALERLARDAEQWAKDEEAHATATATRNANIRRSVNEEGLSLRTVGDAYGVTRQYVGQITGGS